MLPTNLPPTHVKPSYIAEVRQYIPPFDRAEPVHEPVPPPYRLTEVPDTPIINIAPLPTTDFLPVYKVGAGHFSNSSLLPHFG